MSVGGVTFGQAILKARVGIGLSQKELASQVRKEEDGCSISLHMEITNLNHVRSKYRQAHDF